MGYDLAGPMPGMDVDLIEQNPDMELKELKAVLTRDAWQQVKECEVEIMSVIKALGGNGVKYQRERRRAVKAVVSEVYSPPRVTAATKLLPELKIIPGFALDLTTADTDGNAWDFDFKHMRERALHKVRTERPMLLIGSPMCTAFSTWQRINNKIRDPFTVSMEKKRAVEHLEFG